MSTAASAAAPQLAVVEPLAPSDMVGLAGQVALEIEATAQAKKVPLLRAADVRAKLGALQYKALQACGPSPRCVSEFVRALRVDRIVTGTLNRDARAYRVRLALMDLSENRVVSDVDLTILIAARRFVRDVRAAVPGLLQGRAEARGTLVVSTSVPAATLTVDGHVEGQTPVTLTLRTGKHEVRVDKEGHGSVSRWVSVAAHQTTREDIRLIVMPHANGLPPTTEVAPGTSGAGWRLPLASWILFGVAAAGGATGVGFGVATQHLEGRMQTSFDATRGAYGLSRGDAIRGRRMAGLANGFYAGAGAASLAALALAIWGQPPLPLKMASGPTPVGASIEVTF
ncbi:MAG: PEGA domain-containing protein [Myxococcaceae bacterium]